MICPKCRHEWQPSVEELNGDMPCPSAIPCEASGCDDYASLIVCWPGRTVHQCEEHARKAIGIATAMGFDLTIMPLGGG